MGALGFDMKQSPQLHIDKLKKKTAPIYFGKQSNDIHVGIIGYQVSHNPPFSPGGRLDQGGSSASKVRPATTKSAVRGMSNSSPTT
jgi:hypothetical protein